MKGVDCYLEKDHDVIQVLFLFTGFLEIYQKKNKKEIFFHQT